MKYSPWRIHLLFILLLVVGFSFRLVRFTQNYHLEESDVTRDYLIAHHIVAYGEFPTIGPVNSIYAQLPNSPFYYYFLAAPLLVYDNIYTIAALNVFLQFVIIVALYGLAYVLFGKNVALLTGILLLFNQQVISQTYVMWQPHAAQAFFYLSYFFLALGYTRKHYQAIVAAAVCFMTGVGMAFYGFPVLPIFIVLIALSLREIKSNPLQKRIVYISMASMLGLLYIPVIIYLFQTHTLLFFLHEHVYTNSIGAFLDRIITNSKLLIDGWMLTDWVPTQARTIVLVSIGLLFGNYFFMKRTKYRVYAFILLLFLIQLIVITSIFAKNTTSYHFAAGLGLLILLLSEIALSVWPKNILGTLGKIFSAAALFLLVAPSPTYIHTMMTGKNIYMVQTKAVDAIDIGIQNIKTHYGSQWPLHVRFAYYNDADAWIYDMFTPLLESKTHTKLTRISKTLTAPFEPLGEKNAYIIVTCQDYNSQEEAQAKCLPKFYAQYPHHRIERLVYGPNKQARYLIFLATSLE